MLITILYVCNHKGPTPNELNLRMIDCLKKKNLEDDWFPKNIPLEYELVMEMEYGGVGERK